jgi:low affinity Fe/Cu permease
VKDAYRLVARVAPGIVGSPKTVILMLAATVAWVALGPFAGFSDAWLLVPSAVASIVALFLVIILQYSQNRDTRSIQLKLDEVILSISDARTHLVRLEARSDDELAKVEEEFEQVRKDLDAA